MAEYDTKAKTIGDITVTVSRKKGATAGEKLEAFLKWLSEKIVDPGYGVGEGGRPDQGLPGGGGGERPDQGLPGGGEHPDQGLPPGRPGTGGRPPGPDNTLPGGGARPDQGLPGSQPGVDNELPKVIGENAKEIAKLILGKCMDCKDDGSAQPK